MRRSQEPFIELLIMSFELEQRRSHVQQPSGIFEYINDLTNQSGLVKFIRVSSFHPLLPILMGRTKKLIMIEPSYQRQQMRSKHLTLSDFQHPFPWRYQSFYEDTPLGLLALTYDSFGYVPDTYWIQI
jgi:hypothetical protein